MSRRLLALIALAFMAVSAYAIPARPGFRTFTQPDGKSLFLEQKGDEWGSWFTDKSGARYIMDGKGYFLPITESQLGSLKRRASKRRASANSLRSRSVFKDLTHGTRHILVVLVQFTDVKFKTDNPLASFDALLNEPGYNGYGGAGASGSVRDFYLDNSHGAFDPTFDVYGPVTLDNPIKYYGEQTFSSDGTVDDEDKQPELALYDACLKIDDYVDFSQYDSDADNLVDMILFYFAGGSQAEGWPADYIWPHSWSIQGSTSKEVRDHTFDGKKLANYFCSAELKGAPKFSRMCSIGITCHEFGHSLGLPDFYDIDYEENGLNEGLYIFSTMCDGAYNDDSRTPPYFNAEERIMLGWMDESDVKPVAAGDNVLEFIDANVAMRSEATAEGEYFLYEKRGGSGNKWDSFLPEGLVVYHVDKSPSHMIGGRYTAEGIWRTNSINRFGGHPCFTVVPPMAPESTDYANEKVDYSDLVLPGFHEIVSFSPPADWDGNESELSLTNIRLDGNQILFTAQFDSAGRLLDGTVRNTAGSPLEGVTVSINPYADAAVSGMVRIRKLLSSGAQECITGPDGRYSFEISSDAPSDYSLSAALEGYVGQSVTMRLTKKVSTVDFSLRSVGEFGATGEFPFYTMNPDDAYGGVGALKDKSMMAAAKCTRNIWGAYEGLLVKKVQFPTYFDAQAYYFILDSQDGISAVKSPVIDEMRMVSFDISDKGIHIPSGDFHIGYAVENVADNQYNCLMALAPGVGCYTSSLTLDGHGSWNYTSGHDVPLIITLSDEDYIPGLPDIGFPYIDIAPGAFHSGDKVQLSIATSPNLLINGISWTFDGSDVSDGATVELRQGWHTACVTIEYKDGRKDVIEREIEVK